MKKTTIVMLLAMLCGSTFTYAQRYNIITEGAMSDDALSTLAYYKNDLDKLELKGKVKTLIVKGKFFDFAYDGIYRFRPDGKLSLITNPTGTETHTYTYDEQGNLKTCITLRKNVELVDGKRDNEFKTIFNYNNGRLVSHHDILGETIYVYNDQGKLIQIGEDATASRFNAQGQIISGSQGGPVEYTYDATGKLIKRISLDYGMDDVTKKTSTYTYDTKGNIVKENILYQTYEEQFGPKITELRKLTSTHRQQIGYSYICDSKGNWTKLTSSNNVNLTRSIEYYPE